jgi:hypothetical protein
MIKWKLATSSTKTVPNANGSTVYGFTAGGGKLIEQAMSNETSSGPHNTVTTVTTTTSTYDILKGVQMVSVKQTSNSTGDGPCFVFGSTETGSGTFTWQVQKTPVDSSGK